MPSTSNSLDLKYDKTNFTPPKGINVDLDGIVKIINDKIPNLRQSNHTPRYNITKLENEALQKLRNQHLLHITKADKGGAFVILDNSFYIERMYQTHISDTETYCKIDNYAPHLTISKIKLLCNEHKTQCRFTSKELEFLTKFNYKIPLLYGLPKIHKLNINNIVAADKYGVIKIDPPPELTFRPIISSTYAPTSHLSAFVDELLKPLVPGLKSYCRDTYHFIEKLPINHQIDNNSIFASFDVVSLYTSIPHNLGLEAIHYWLQKCENELCERFTRDFILSSVALVLKNNFFQFKDEIYLQKSGTAMGTKMAPTYAILVMGFLEENMYTRLKNIYPSEIAEEITYGWIRYIDDCFIIWHNRFGDIDPFINMLQDLNPAIKFTYDKNKDSLHFLDVIVEKDNGKVQINIYHKPTDSRNYVPFNSAHPKHVLVNIPFSLARRAHRLVSTAEKKRKRTKRLRNNFKELELSSQYY